ncbi:hypothetical protein MNB_SUP05-5-1055 [hydrothermal vent metagenome]|uniref:HicB-like antitoxin of toxin-antitoxin system domain-containing protein n=1 Tax=hydrothermal vent metagenome TaxID=652676 RepID=A0A1W1CHA4_9ZZZZ
MKANIRIDIKVEFIKDENGYTALADIFGAYGMGDTKIEAQKSLKKSLDIFIDDYINRGVLMEVLEKQGLKKKIILPKSTKTKTYKKINYDIPLNNYGKERLHA